jgi:hypothetical protein
VDQLLAALDDIHSSERVLRLACQLTRAAAEHPGSAAGAAADLARLVAETILRIEIEALIEEADARLSVKERAG